MLTGWGDNLSAPESGNVKVWKRKETTVTSSKGSMTKLVKRGRKYRSRMQFSRKHFYDKDDLKPHFKGIHFYQKSK